MFPEITRDEVFRLETRRLWLRWANPADAAYVARLETDRASTAPRDKILPDVMQAAERRIRCWRAENLDGSALHLVLAGKGEQAGAIGRVHIVPGRGGAPSLSYALLEDRRGHGLMTESVQAVVDAAFMLAGLSRLHACPRVGNEGGRRVLERCGFTFCGIGLDESRSRRGLEPCDQFCLGRATWRSLKTWGIPGLGAYVAEAASAAARGCRC